MESKGSPEKGKAAVLTPEDAGGAEIVAAATVKREARDIETVAADLEVKDEITHAAATTFLARIAKATKAAEKDEDFLVKPLKQHIKDIQARFKPGFEILERVDAAVREKVRAYLRQREEARLQEEERQRQAQATQRKNARALGMEVPTSALAPATVEAAPKTIRTEEGASTQVKVWKFKVTDLELVPTKYVKREIKTKAVLDDLKDGKRDIPGIEAWEDFDVRVTS